MGKKAEETTADVENTVEVRAEVRVSKGQLLKSDRYKNDRDVLTVKLADGGSYTFEEVDGIIENYRKGKVI